MSEPAVGLVAPEQFLACVWPTSGYRALFAGGRHHWVESAAAGAAKAADLDASDLDVYFSVASFSSRSRRAAGAVMHRLFVVDYDVGAGGNKYQTLEEARAAAYKWVEDHRFHLPTFEIRSGNGLYFIWVLTHPVPTDRWRPVAERFKHAMGATGLKFDPAITADAARVIRVPGTRNHKELGNPKPCFVAAMPGSAVSLEDFEHALPLVGPRPLPGSRPAGADNPFMAVTHTEFPPADAEAIVAKCAQMRQALDDRGVVEEPLWRARLSVLWRCAGGEELIHDFSRGDPRYNPAQTEAKASGTAGPATCAHFASINAPACSGCQFAGKITSPILLGSGLPETPPPPTLPDEDPAEEKINELGNWRVTADGVRLIAPDETTGVDVLKRVTQCPLWVMEVRERAVGHRDDDAHSSLALQWHALDGQTRRAVCRQSDVYEKKNFVAWLANHNLISAVDNPALLSAYIKDCTAELARRRKTAIYYDHLGWNGDDFIVAGHRVSPSGITPARVQSSTNIGALRPAKGGSATAWGRVVASLGWDQAYHKHAFAVLAGLASPLVSLAGWQSAVLSLAGPTGTGKTTSMAVALSAYGDPEQQIMSSAATVNAVEVQMGVNKNIPVGVDEISRWHHQRIVDFSYAGSNGSGRATLTRNRDMRQAQHWALVPIVTTNHPIYEYPLRFIGEPVRRRVLELLILREETLPASLATELHNAADRHYGHPALAFMQYVVANKADVLAQLHAADETVQKETALHESDRFLRWLFAASLVAGHVAVKAGLLPEGFPVDDIVGRLLVVAATANGDIPGEDVRFVDAIGDFLLERADSVIYWAAEGGGTRAGMHAGLVESDAHRPVARYDYQTGDLYIHAAPLKEFLRDRDLSLRNVQSWARTVGVEEKSFRIARNLSPVRCLLVPTHRVGLIMREENNGDT